MHELMRGAKIRFSCARFALAAAVLAATQAPAHAETEAMNAQLNVVAPGSFYKIEDLHFGTVVASATAGSVIVAPDGTRSASGGVTLWGNDHHPAQFAGMKPTQANRPVRINVAANTIQVTGPGAPMTVRLFNGNTNPGQPFTTNPRNFQVQQAVSGAFALYVGATLDVNANQAPGTYTGTWTITLNYQ
jgi:spore coat protein U-like protein